jgi:hypothetical protein
MNESDLQYKQTGPVVIGGVGGSGTGLIAQCLKEAGYQMGSDLNKANDNLWFTLLFKRLEILTSSEEEFDRLLGILLNGMAGAKKFTRYQIDMINALAAKDREQHSASWLRKRAKTLLSAKAGRKLSDRWGWKEPNSHIVLDRLLERLENMKYIHVARNGLDMAHSTNQNQLRLWGPHFIREPFGITPYYSLKYWCIVHRRVLTIGQSMRSNFLFLRYDDFCLKPESGVRQLCEFLKLETDGVAAKLVKLIRPPDSIGRFRQYGTGIFAAEDVAYVKFLGFDVGYS